MIIKHQCCLNVSGPAGIKSEIIGRGSMGLGGSYITITRCRQKDMWSSFGRIPRDWFRNPKIPVISEVTARLLLKGVGPWIFNSNPSTWSMILNRVDVVLRNKKNGIR